MSFEFRKIELKDWLVYGGTAILEFPSFEPGRNLAIVNGQNGFGKTSLLRALQFVFRGGYGKDELKEVWNERARTSGEGSVSVGIEFTHSGRDYKIIRGADFRHWGEGTACIPWTKLIVDGQEEQDQVDDKIEQILPGECLEFVFFDGAEISRYAVKQQESGVKDAIEKVLGIPAVRNLREDLEKLVRELEDEQEQLLISVGNANELLSEIDDLKAQDASYRQRRQGLSDKRAALEQTIRQLDKEADGVKAIETIRLELQEKYKRRADYEERRAELEEQIQDLVRQAPLRLLRKPLTAIVEELRSKDAPSERRERQQALLLTLKDLREKEVCLCNRELDDAALTCFNEEIDRLEALLKEAPAHSQEERDLLFDLTTILRTLDATPGNGEDLIDRKASNDNRLEELRTDIQRLEEQLEGHEEVTIRELFEQLASAKKQRDELVEQVHAIDGNLAALATELQQKQRELDQLGVTDGRAREVTLLLEETRRLQKAVSVLVNRLVKEKRTTIEESATEVFRSITNKPDEYDRIRVNADYTLEIVRQDSTVVEHTKLSAGEKEVLAYSFITALNLSSVDPAPFVMDTPFGHLDSGHRKGLLNSLPKLEVQAILLATDRDLPPAERDSIDGSISKEFTLKRDQRKALTTVEDD